MSTNTVQCVSPRFYLALRTQEMDTDFAVQVQTDPAMSSLIDIQQSWTYPNMVSELVWLCYSFLVILLF